MRDGGKSLFGYIRILKDELRVREYNMFRSYYCGLCKTIKSEYGFASRMGLSYDVTFLALVLSSVNSEETEVLPERCIVSPFNKKPTAQKTDELSYAAAVNVMLGYLKLSDDWHDERSLKALLCMPLFWGAKRKAKKRHGELFNEIKMHLDKLSLLEKEKCSEIDRLANEFGLVLSSVFNNYPDGEQVEKRILSHMGYMLGRFIYILDAYEDREKDKKKKCFNPFLLNKDNENADEIKESLMFTLSDVSNSYKLLNIKRNRPILDNIIYLGLPDSVEKVFCGGIKKENTTDERSI